MVAKIDRTGETFVTNEGCKAIIVNYVNAREVYIKFEESEELVKTMYSKVKTKSIKNPYLPSLYFIPLVTTIFPISYPSCNFWILWVNNLCFF